MVPNVVIDEKSKPCFSAEMNKPQRRLSWIALIVFALTLLAAPVRERSESGWGDFKTVSYRGAYTPIFAVNGDQSIRFDALALEWLGIGILYVGLFFVFKKGSNAV